MKTRLLVIIFLLAGVAGNVRGQEVVVDNVKYTIAGNSAYVFGYTEGIISANIVESVTYASRTYSVTLILYRAFYNCTNLQSVTIPPSVTSIGRLAFDGCISLQEINIPNSVTSIESSVFEGCVSLKSISLPSNLTSISSSTFEGCTGLEDITMPNSVTSIESSAFRGCMNLRPINFSANLISIGDYAFGGCDAFTLIYIPKNVTTIGKNAFVDIKGLQSVYCESSQPIGGKYDSAFNNSTATLHIPKGTSDAYRQSSCWNGFFTEGTVVEGDWSRFTKDNLQYVCNGDKITANVIQCDLSVSGEVIVPERITTNLDKDYTVTAIETGAFRNCKNIATIKLSGNIQDIGNYAFKNCIGLESIVISNRVLHIQEGTFDCCVNLKEVILPLGLQSIDKEAFANCGNLPEITVPEGAQIINERAFANCTSLAKITLPVTLERIEKEAFANNSILENIILPDKVSYVGESAFNGCTALKNVRMSGKVTEIGESAFQGCSGIENIEVRSSVPPKVYYNTFHNYRATLHVPEGSKSAYQAAEYWKYFTNVTEDMILTAEVVIDGVKYALDAMTGKAIVTGYTDGLLTTVTLKGTIEYGTNKDKYTVTEIAGKAFYKSENLKSIIIPEGIVKIGSSAFSVCRNLSSIELPESLIEIGSSAFSYTALTQVTIPSGVTEMEYSTFVISSLISINVSSANKVYSSINGVLFDKSGTVLMTYPQGRQGDYTIPSGIERIKEHAFYSSEGLTSVSMPASVIVIENDAFSYCSGLRAINVLSTNTAYASQDGVLFNKLKTVLLKYPDGRQGDYSVPSGVTNIEQYAFQADGLSMVTLPTSLTTIADAAFSASRNVKDIYCMAVTPPSIKSNTFYSSDYITLHVPVGCKVVYENDVYWKKFKYIIEGLLLPEEKIVDGVKYKLDPNTGEATVIGYTDDLSENVTLLSSIFGADNTKYKVVAIGESAFSGCKIYKRLILPEGIMRIERFAFNWSSLESIFLSESVNEINSSAFDYVTSLLSIEVASSNSVYASKDGVLFDKGLKILICYPNGKQGHYSIPEGVEMIGVDAFSFNDVLTSLMVPVSLVSISSNFIENNTFRHCSNLTSIDVARDNSFYSSIDGVLFNKEKTNLISYPRGKQGNGYVIPEGVSSIGREAFYSTNLSWVTIPEEVNSIDFYAFYDCQNLTDIYCKPQTPPILSEYAFKTYDAMLHVYQGCKTVYENADYWKSFTNIVEETEMSISSVDSERVIYYADGTLFLQGIDASALVTVYTMEGKCVHSCSIFADEKVCDLSMLADGIYIVRICAGDKVVNIKILK